MPDRKNEAIWSDNQERWHIKVQVDGERRSFYSYRKGKKGKVEADKKADKWLDDRTIDESIRLNKLYNKFLEEVKTLTSEKNYTKHEQMGRLWLLPSLEHKKVKDITIQNWQSCINAAYKKGLSKKSCQNIRGSITALYKYAKKNRIPLEKPDDLIIPKDAPVKKKIILQPKDIKTLFSVDTIRRHNRIEKCFQIYAWRFLLVSGLRRAEICSLRSDDISDGILHVQGTKTAAADRYIYLSSHMNRLLEQQKDNLKTNSIISPYIFPDIYGEQMNPDHLTKTWKAYKKQNDIKSTLHGLRHTLISVSKSDMPEELLKLVVGHTPKTDTFGIYGHEVEGDLKRAADIFDNIFDNLLK